MTDTTIAFTPAEWAPQSAIWAGWPHLKDAWADDYEGAKREIAALIEALAPVVRVKLVIGDKASRAEAAELVGDKAEMFDAPMGDIWLRDIGPVFVKYLNRLEGLGFEFNGWGGEYELEGDRETAGAIARLEGHPLKRLPFVLEGGAVEQDGEGTLITTRQCVLNPNRNPDWSQEKAEDNLKLAFNAASSPPVMSSARRHQALMTRTPMCCVRSRTRCAPLSFRSRRSPRPGESRMRTANRCPRAT